MANKMSDQFKVVGDTMRKSGERIAETGTELGMRLLDQAEANTREAFAAMRAAAHARDVSEVMRIQSDYLREQSNRAMEQAREIGELITRYGRDTIGQMTNRD
ncbi:MAG: phasin [Sphingobium sp.]|nr:phasin [Sphingobium sp.]